jgi:hypothetical protein
MKQRKSLLTLAAAVLLLAVAAFPYFRMTAAAQPGEATDPLVTRRYVDEHINTLWAEIQLLREETAALRALVSAGGFPGHPSDQTWDTQALANAIFPNIMISFELMYGEILRNASERSLSFEALRVESGQSIIVENGTELILRSGRAVVVAGPNGLVNMTSGTDLENGQAVPANHLLIAPRTDGRGLRFTADSWIMVRGGYRLE